jgi:hypothetical protein
MFSVVSDISHTFIQLGDDSYKHTTYAILDSDWL